MSELAYRIRLMQRALARINDKTAAHFAPHYLAKARELAGRVIAGDY